jgi:hypothetical protein
MPYHIHISSRSKSTLNSCISVMILGALFAAAASVPRNYIVCGLLGPVFLWQGGRLLDRLWWRSWRFERALRAQGFRGTSYRFLTGDLKEFCRLNDEAWSVGAAAAGMPRHRPSRHAVHPQERPGARQDVFLVVWPDTKRDHYRPGTGQG